jgi:hypothetical protein
MRIRSAIENSPILSGVSETGEFRIRNSAKAFGILSSGLYANKIRAIIREYSCNAVDSHIEAGRSHVPFDVHLPSSLEPWFAVRDYGVGLDDNQVKNIFTTYFESTKTSTDDLIGGLGLGSKSAFSYTENFTITAIKNGMKWVFTAFISDTGVPSIALMAQEQSDEPTGVEIRFAVENEHDFRKFETEAQHVFKHFKLRPVVSSGREFHFIEPEYVHKDLVPGVHLLSQSRGQSYAVMGNIEYPIDIPENATSGDKVFNLLNCGLEIHFNIGELDIQASREGLSYIPETIAAIRSRLVELNNALEGILINELSQYNSVWEIFPVLEKKSTMLLWSDTVKNYIQNRYPDDFNIKYYKATPKLKFVYVDVLKNNYNIIIFGFTVRPVIGGAMVKNIIKTSRNRNITNGLAFEVSPRTKFVVNDTKTGVLERVKNHWRKNAYKNQDDLVYVLSPADKTKPMDLSSFWRILQYPPKKQIFKASEFDKVVRQVRVPKNTYILKMHSITQNRKEKTVWGNAGKLSQFDDSTTYYYVPLKGYESLGKVKDMYFLSKALIESKIYTGEIYGVRKKDIKAIKERSNWVLLDDLIESKLANLELINVMSMVKNEIRYNEFYKFDHTLNNLVSADSPYLSVAKVFEGVKNISVKETTAIYNVLRLYGSTLYENTILALANQYKTELKSLRERYPLLDRLPIWTEPMLIADYINMVDQVKGK